MADDSIEISEKLEFHPCNTPRGCLYYNPKILTDCQQLKLNQMKLAVVKSDEKYLHKHPEIRGFIALITRHVFKQRPHRNIAISIKEFFDRPRGQIETELEGYLKSRSPIEPEVEAEESDFSEDYNKYLRAMRPSVEEKSSTSTTSRHIPLKGVNTEEFVRQLLIDRIQKFPSKHGLVIELHEPHVRQNPWFEGSWHPAPVRSSFVGNRRSKSFVSFIRIPTDSNQRFKFNSSESSLHQSKEEIKARKADSKSSKSTLSNQSDEGDDRQDAYSRSDVREIHKELLNSVHELKSVFNESLSAVSRRSEIIKSNQEDEKKKFSKEK